MGLHVQPRLVLCICSAFIALPCTHTHTPCYHAITRGKQCVHAHAHFLASYTALLGLHAQPRLVILVSVDGLWTATPTPKQALGASPTMSPSCGLGPSSPFATTACITAPDARSWSSLDNQGGGQGNICVMKANDAVVLLAPSTWCRLFQLQRTGQQAPVQHGIIDTMHIDCNGRT